MRLNTRLIVTVFLFSISLCTCIAKPPRIDPFDQVIGRFWSEELEVFRRVSEQLAQENSSDTNDLVDLKDGMRGYMRNINADIRVGLNSAMKARNADDLTLWYSRLGTNLVGFRRTLDQLLIIRLRSNPQFIDESLELDLKRIWDVERSLSWRIDYEIWHHGSMGVEGSSG